MSTRRRELLAFGGNAPPPATEGYWSAPDPMLVDAGASGEFLVAKVRLVLVSLVTLIPIYNVIFTPYLVEAWIGLASSLGALVDRKSTRLNSSHSSPSRMPYSA